VTAAATCVKATLEIERLSAGYDGAPVVRDLTLAVASGEVVALMGANGAGKTTTLRAVSGLVKPMGGRVRLDGADLAGVSPTARARRGIVHVPHDRGIFFGLTVAEHFRLDGVTQDGQEAAFDHFPALRNLRNRKAGLLSGGEQQMLALGRALMGKPMLLLLDEPSIGIAHRLKSEIFQAIRTIQQAGTAVLLVEQDAHSALAIAERAYVLEHGRIVRHGSAGELARDDAIRRVYLGM
jgi:branched-chain amino acid transport system ATP-binding protein